MSFLSLPEVAVSLQIPVHVLREMCERGMIRGAVRFGRIWTLPETVYGSSDFVCQVGKNYYQIGSQLSAM